MWIHLKNEGFDGFDNSIHLKDTSRNVIVQKVTQNKAPTWHEISCLEKVVESTQNTLG